MSRKKAVFKMGLSQRANLMGFTAQPTQKNKREVTAEFRLSMKF
jgi:hypothetical protein